MKALSKLVCIGAIVAFAGGTAMAGESRVVFKIEGRNGIHVHRVIVEEPTSMAIYPSGENVEFVVKMAERQTGAFPGTRGRSGYRYTPRTAE